MTKELEPLTPSEAKEMFLAERRGQVAERTVQADDYRLRHFIRWAEDNGLDNLNDLDGRTLHKFRLWRKEDVDLNKVSLRTQLKSLRVFIKWCESIDAVEQELHEKILLPTPSKEEERREETLRTGQAEDVLQYLRRFEYASRTHALLELLWHSGLRIGAVYSLDIDDYDAEEDRLELTHRPETGTALKNKTEGERMVALSRYVCEVLDDYIDHNRLDVIDDHDRGPLFIDVEPSCDSVVKWVRLEPGRWAIRRAVSGPTSLWRAVSTILWRAVSTISYGRAKKERLL